SKSAYFQAIDQLGKAIKKPVPLKIDDFIVYMNQLDALFSTLDHRDDLNDQYKVSVSGMNQALFSVDTFHREISNSALEEIKRSFYIREAFDILTTFQDKK